MDTNIKATFIKECAEKDVIEYVAEKGFDHSMHRLYTQQFIDRSEKFFVGDVDSIPITAIEPDTLRLPFKETYIEFIDQGFALVAFCSEHMSSCYAPTEDEEYRFAVRNLIISPEKDVLDTLYLTIFYLKKGVPCSRLYKLTDTPSDEGYKQALLEQDADLYKSLTYTNTKLLHFLTLLSCSNIGIKEIEAPAKLNRKRKEQGKLPFYRFKTLFIRHSYDKRQTKGEGTHASPCLHWRRGHIRRLTNPNRRIWVSASLVGDPKKGFQDKVYSTNLN